MTFRDASLRLTGFYVLIIMAISLVFSVWVYNEATRELQFGLNANVGRFGNIIMSPDLNNFLEERANEGRMRILFNLTALNVAVLAVGAAAGYVLARRTLRPIEDAVAAKDRFTADASHELRTPLAAMKAEIEVALRDKQRTKQETEALLHSNLEEIDRLSALAEGLLVLTNEETNLSKEPVRIDEVLRAVCDRFMPLAAAKTITLHCETPEIQTQAQQLHIEKIVGILVDNAIKYSPEKTTINIEASKRNDQVIITVTDQGYGIKASDLPHIFDRFYRADSSRSKTHVAGHGLGLSIAHQLASSLGASLRAESVPGKGSTFTLALS